MYFSSFVYIYILLLSSADNNRSIYIERRIEENTLQTALEGEDSLGKGFSLGENYFRKWGLAIFWGSQVS